MINSIVLKASIVVPEHQPSEIIVNTDYSSELAIIFYILFMFCIAFSIYKLKSKKDVKILKIYTPLIATLLIIYNIIMILVKPSFSCLITCSDMGLPSFLVFVNIFATFLLCSFSKLNNLARLSIGLISGLLLFLFCLYTEGNIYLLETLITIIKCQLLLLPIYYYKSTST